MPESYRALIVVLLLSVPVMYWSESAFFSVAKRHPAVRKSGQPTRDLRLWKIWALVSSLAFTLPSLPLFLGAAASVLLLRLSSEPLPAALFISLMLAIPEISFDLPTFGLVEHLMPLNFPTLLTLLMLFPALMQGRLKGDRNAAARLPLILYVIWLCLLALLTSNFTSFLRTSVLVIIGTFLPFEGARLSIFRAGNVHRFIAAYVIAACAIAVTAMFEYVKGWLLYASLPGFWGISYGLLHYLQRGAALRAQTSIGQPIALGFVISLALVFAVSPLFYQGQRKRRIGVIVILAGGLFATVSRGPWLAAFVGLGAYLVSAERGGLKRLAAMITAVAFGIMAAFVVPGGERVTDALPWIGKLDAGSSGYRHDLFSAAFPLLLDNPIYGIPDYDTRPELQFLRQGEGIIDLVNTFIGVGVNSGLVGLSLFLFANLAILARLWAELRPGENERRELVRVLLAAHTTMLAVLATTSSISIIQPLFWAMLGAESAALSLLHRPESRHT